MNQQPAPLISTLLTTRTFLLEYVIGGRLTKCHGTTVFVRPFSIPSTVVPWQPKTDNSIESSSPEVSVRHNALCCLSPLGG